MGCGLGPSFCGFTSCLVTSEQSGQFCADPKGQAVASIALEGLASHHGPLCSDIAKAMLVPMAPRWPGFLCLWVLKMLLLEPL